MPETKIEWADDSENAASGCSEAVLPSGKMDPACVNCYARLMSARLDAMGQPLYAGVAIRTGNAARWTGVFRWKRDMLRRKFDRMKGGHRVFLGSMTDLWHEKHDPGLLVALAEEIRRLGERPREKQPFLITLTKRAGRLLIFQREHFPDGLPIFVWPGVTAGCQEAADERIPLLLQVRADGPRVVSVEPMTGPVDLTRVPMVTDDGGHPTVRRSALTMAPGWVATSTQSRIGWVIAGGESGQKARPSHPDWFRAVRDQCVEAGVPFHFKQHGEFFEVAAESRDPETGDHVTRDPDDPNDAATFVPGLSVGVAPDGRVVRALDAMEEGVPYRHMKRVGKTAAGRLLDGRTWDELPTTGANP